MVQCLANSLSRIFRLVSHNRYILASEAIVSDNENSTMYVFELSTVSLYWCYLSIELIV